MWLARGLFHVKHDHATSRANRWEESTECRARPDKYRASKGIQTLFHVKQNAPIQFSSETGAAGRAPLQPKRPLAPKNIGGCSGFRGLCRAKKERHHLRPLHVSSRTGLSRKADSSGVARADFDAWLIVGPVPAWPGHTRCRTIQGMPPGAMVETGPGRAGPHYGRRGRMLPLQRIASGKTTLSSCLAGHLTYGSPRSLSTRARVPT